MNVDDPLRQDVEAIARVDVVPTILDVLCRTTGMGFAAVARVTDRRWVCCSSLDHLNFGLKPGGELQIETTICNEIRSHGEPVVINHVAEDAVFCTHPTPAMYGFQSYVSFPIWRRSGEFFGTLCAIDPKPARVETPEVMGMFRLFGDLISLHLDAQDRLETIASEATELARARRDAEAAQRLTELAVETGRMGSWRLDLRTHDRWNSARCLANFGLPPEASLSYEDVIRAQHPEDREHVRAAMAAAIDNHSDYCADYRVIWPDGSCHWLSARGRIMYAEDGTPLFMAGNTLDVTEQRRLLEELRDAKDELEQRVSERTEELASSNASLQLALAQSAALEEARRGWIRVVMSAQEDERRRVARELHDEMSQHLLALTIGLHQLDGAGASVARLQALVSKIDLSVHRLARDLRPAELDDLGLIAAVKAYVDEWSRNTSIAADASSRNCAARLPPHIESTLYRIVQEALTNVARHAQARQASVVIERREHAVVVVIEDDGVGFDVSAVGTAGADRFGLVGMRERAALLDGSISVESTGQGTSVFVTIPLDAHTGDG